MSAVDIANIKMVCYTVFIKLGWVWLCVAVVLVCGWIIERQEKKTTGR